MKPKQSRFSAAMAVATIALIVIAVPALATTPDQATLNKELARVRAATAKYADVAQAEADGYVNINFCEPNEGCHWLNSSLINGTADIEHPQSLNYTPTPDGGWRLVSVEYLVPIVLSPNTPQAFTGDHDSWRQDTEGFGLWELTVWVWLHNPTGIFEQFNPRVP